MIDVLLDADVLGRQRTGDETYVENLLRELPAAAPDLRFAAVTRNPDRVPEGIESVELPAGSQELRMAWRLPRLLRRVRPRLGHFQHALPLGAGRSVLTVHDLSFEREPELMPRKDRWVFKTAVPRSARRADRVIAVSERTKEDLIELYRLPEDKIRVIPHGVDPIVLAGRRRGRRLPALRRRRPATEGSARRARSGAGAADAARRRRPGA